jgi:uracil-DNA glycosylase
MRGFVLSDEFLNIITTLKEQVEEGYRFTPILKNLFRAFTECPIENFKGIFIVDGPYAEIGTADGVAFSCKEFPIRRPEQMMLEEAIKCNIENDSESYSIEKDLSSWANQGILMLNSSLTTKIDRHHSHFVLWSPFIAYLIDMINTKLDCKFAVLFGEKSSYYKDLFSDKGYVQSVDHPSELYKKGLSGSVLSNVFKGINDELINSNLKPIVW